MNFVFLYFCIFYFCIKFNLFFQVCPLICDYDQVQRVTRFINSISSIIICAYIASVQFSEFTILSTKQYTRCP